MPDEIVPGLIPVAPPEPLDRQARERARTGLTVGGLAFLGFLALFAAVKAERSERIDMAITLRLQARRHRWLGRLMEACSWPGFPPQSRVIPPLIIAGLALSNHRTEAAFQGLAWCTGGLSEVLKSMMRRQRPLPEQVRVVVAPLGGSSFPSGHVLTYMGTYGFAAYLAYTLIGSPAVRWPVVLLLLAMLAGVGPSRIYQGHHWPTDVAASYLLGICYLIVLEAAYRRLRAPDR
ncbi:MAG TPA: phosphatase PAP2 family protein [Candidatus Limnocylindrales bacterium]|nr:phosphatase PAP2 family protein [Candidatus Limnocylindrales bacterium]